MITVRPTHILSSALISTTLLTGCGGSAEENQPAKATATPAPKFTPGQVSAFIEDVTGDQVEYLSPAGPRDPWTTIVADRSDFDRSQIMEARYGDFMIYVLNRPDAAGLYKNQDGQRVRPDSAGIYWHDDHGRLTAMKPYRNVVLAWTAEEEKVTDERFDRLDGLLAKLGQPAEEVRAAMPEAEQPCADPPADGVCRAANGATVTTVARGDRLKLPALEAKLVKVQTGRVAYSGRRYSPAQRAKGRFVLTGLRIKNTGEEPLRSLYDVKLKIGERIYDQSSEATWTVMPLDAFPLQPDDTTTAAIVFDLPVKAARAALTDGVLAFPAGDDLADLEDAPEIGQIRLAKPDGANA